MPSFARPTALVAVGSAGPMSRAIASFSATLLLCAACAPTVPPRDPPAHLVLAEAAPAPLAPEATEPEARSAPKEEHASAAMPRAIGWYSIGFGASAAIVAVGTSFMMLHQESVRNDNCNAAKACNTDGINANGQLQALSWWNVASYIAAGVGLGVGTILVLTNPKGDRQTALQVSPNGSGAGLTLRSTF